MRHLIAAVAASLALGVAALAEGQPDPGWDWAPWRSLPVLDAGRYKPLDTLARETLRTIAGTSRLADPETGRTLAPTAAYLAMLFDWQGWDQPADPHAMAGSGVHGAYFAAHQPDKWDRADLLRVDSSALREALGMSDGERSISPFALSQARIRDPQTGDVTPFLSWTGRLYRAKQQGSTRLEEEALELADRLWSYQAHRMGTRLYVLPVPGSEHQEWVSISSLLRSDPDRRTDPSGNVRTAREQFQKARAAYLAGSPEAFREATSALMTAVWAVGPRLGPYPRRGMIDLELAYNRWPPFRFAWVFTLMALVCLLLGVVARQKAFSAAGTAALVAGLVAMLVGFTVRTILSGRAPVTNFYESVVFMALGTVVLGLVFGLLSRKQYLLSAAAAVATTALVLADYSPGVLDPSIRPLVPILRSNFWLAVHVITIMLSYAAFALALAVGNITLGYYLAGARRQEAVTTQARFTYKSLQAGVLLLVVGTVLGAMWADCSWGRFWGWDPKEVWALITLLAYLAVLHARCAGWIGNRGLAAWSVLSFTVVVMAWYGVNLLRTGLHNYAFGGRGAEYYVLGAVLVEALYVAAASARYFASGRRLATAGATGLHA